MIPPVTPLRPAIAFVAEAPPEAVPCIAITDAASLPAGCDSPWLRLRGVPKAEGEAVLVPAATPTLLVALGTAARDRHHGTRIGAAIFRAASNWPGLSLHLPDFAGVDLQGLFEGLMLAAYRFDQYRSDPKPVRLGTVHVTGADAAAESALARARAVVQGVHVARDLVNEPGSVATAAAIADMATQLGVQHGFGVQAWGPERLRAEGFGGVLGVNRGSVAEPRFLELEYVPAEDALRSGRTIALVGKGVTFDSGGLNTKNTRDMTWMKKDMAGAAAVIGAFASMRALDVRQRVLGYVPLTDNMSGPDATRPGDVLRIRGGKTIEVLDTDCEGRLILADALAYAGEQAPDLIVDVATLTGTVAIAIGRGTAALMGNDDALMAAVQAAGKRTSELVWPFPLPDELRARIRSEIADYRNNADLQGYTQIAAALLREFVPAGIPWAHLDMASPSLLDSARHEHPAGATGWGVRLLLDFLAHDA